MIAIHQAPENLTSTIALRSQAFKGSMGSTYHMFGHILEVYRLNHSPYWPYMRYQGLVNGPMFHITQLLGISFPTDIWEGDVKQITKKGHLPTAGYGRYLQSIGSPNGRCSRGWPCRG